MIANSINSHLAKCNIKFTLEGTKNVDDQRCSASLQTGSSAADSLMKTRRQGNASTLNILYATPPDGKESVVVVGWCWVPVTGSPLGGDRDTCVLNSALLLDQDANVASSIGMETMHEVGHWLGLVHACPGTAGQHNIMEAVA